MFIIVFNQQKQKNAGADLVITITSIKYLIGKLENLSNRGNAVTFKVHVT